MLAAEEEGNQHFGRVEHYFPNDSAILFEKWTIGREQDVADFLERYYYVPYIVCILYGAGIYYGQKWMQNRPPFRLRTQLFAWNLFLAILSAWGGYRFGMDTLNVIWKHGVHVSICHPCGYTGVTSFWGAMFVYSKIFELGDTVFIVLRKQNLQTLHWYHHMTVLCLAWYTYYVHMAVGRYYCTINYLVHAIMYTYFALRAAQVRLPNRLSRAITTLQITQMFFGIWSTSHAMYVRLTGGYCRITWTAGVLGILMYISFVFLFGEFFLNKYIRFGRSPAPKEVLSSSDETKANGNGVSNGHHYDASQGTTVRARHPPKTPHI